MKKRISYILLIVATVIWGLAFVAQKAATVIPPFTVGTIRSLLATLFLICLIPLTDRLTKNGRRLFNSKKIPDFTRQELIGGAILGVIITVATAFQQYGIGGGTDAGKAAFITALYVVVVPLISTFFGKRPHIEAIISIPIAIVGFFLLCIHPGVAFELSDLLVLVCALIFAAHIIVVDRFSSRCDGVRMSCIQFLVAFILNGILSLIFDPPVSLAEIGSVILPILFLGILSSGVAYTLQILGQKEIDPTVSSLILSLESMFGVIGGIIIMGESMSPREYIGCGVVFLAIILAQLDLKAIFRRLKRKKDE